MKFDNAHQIYLYLSGQHESEQPVGIYKLSKNTVGNHIKDGKLNPARGGGFTKNAVDKYARNHLVLKDASKTVKAPKLDEDGEGAQSRRVNADADLKRVQADKISFNFDKELGKYILRTILHGELSARSRVFRMSLEKWGMDRTPAIADIFGGGADESRQLCEMLGLDPVQSSPIIVEFTQSQIKKVTDMWGKDIEGFLDSYSYGRFLTAEAEQEFLATEQAFQPVYEVVSEKINGLLECCRNILGDKFREFLVYNAMITVIMEKSK